MDGGTLFPEIKKNTAATAQAGTGQISDKERTAPTLIPGQVDIDPERIRHKWALVVLDEGVPKEWTAGFVGARLVDAMRVLGRMPTGGGSAKSGCWPPYQTMTKSEMRELLNEHQSAGTLGEFYRSLNRVRIPPSSHEITRMEEAIAWPAKYLRDDPALAGIVSFWANEETDMHAEAPGPVRIGLREIAKGLRRDGVKVR